MSFFSRIFGKNIEINEELLKSNDINEQNTLKI